MEQIRPTVCARALLVFRVACTCSLACNVGRLCENCSPRVLIVLDSILLRKWKKIRW